MIAALAPYAEYKATEKEWFGVVPKHWDVLPNRSLFSEVKDRNHPDEEMLSVTIKRGVVRQKTLLADSSKKDSSNLNKSAYKLVQPADIAYNKMRTWQGAIGVSEFRGIISPAYIVMRLRNKENTPRYFHHLYRTPQFAKEAERWSYGITSDMWSLRPEHFKVIYTPQPSREEQDAIVRFLNWANIRLEKAIRAKRKVIALLNEQKQAIIHRAVTRGLDSSVPLKPSGILWLGDIPQHWNVRRLRFLIKGRLTYGANAAAEFTNLDWPRYIRITDFRSDGTLKSDTFRSLPPAVASQYLLETGDILLARSGATVGKAFLVSEDTGLACHAGYLIRARADRNLIMPEYLFDFTQSIAFASWKDLTFNTATIQNIGADKYSNLCVPLPKLEEQQQIIEFIKTETNDLNSTIKQLEHEIELLREYRTRLVSDVVTGKLDVRTVTARLPDEEMPEEMETSSEGEIPDKEIAV